LLWVFGAEILGAGMDAFLKQARAGREGNHLQRSLRALDSADAAEICWEGRTFINFASNDYLGLSQDGRLKEAAIRAVEKFGAGSGASRLITGTLPVHRELEEAIAEFKGTEAALSFSSGYAAAVGAITSLVGAGDVVVLDKLVHASLVDGARLSGAKLRVFTHNDVEDLERILEWTRNWRAEKADAKVLVVTESVFSMDGDCAPLREIVALKNRFEAWLMVDEAHALGVLGPGRRGLAEELGVAREIEVQMGTLGKAAGASGGFIAGSSALIDHLINTARSFIFSTAPEPAAAASARAGIEIIASAEGGALRKKLFGNIGRVRAEAGTAILPIILGDEQRALDVSEKLKEAGVLVPAIRFPTVARGQARLRISLSAAHTSEQIDLLMGALKHI
jgi:8-amino-7-oxononanoate synthase